MEKFQQVQLVSTTPDDLAKLISDKVIKDFESMLQGIKTTPEKKEFITREEAANLLNVTYATLWRYGKSGKLKSYNFSNKVYYKLAEIEQGFTKNV